MRIGQWLFRVPPPPLLLNPHPAPSCTRHAAHRPRPSRQSRRGQPPHTGVAGGTDITVKWPRDPAKRLPPGLAIALPRAGNRIARGRQLNCPRPAIEVPAAGTRCTSGRHSMYQRPALDVPRAGTRCTKGRHSMYQRMEKFPAHREQNSRPLGIVFPALGNHVPSPWESCSQAAWEFLWMAEHWLKRRGGGANGRRSGAKRTKGQGKRAARRGDEGRIRGPTFSHLSFFLANNRSFVKESLSLRPTNPTTDHHEHSPHPPTAQPYSMSTTTWK